MALGLIYLATILHKVRVYGYYLMSRAGACVCVRACLHACMHACMCACVCVYGQMDACPVVVVGPLAKKTWGLTAALFFLLKSHKNKQGWSQSA